jgi:hypothetical protein
LSFSLNKSFSSGTGTKNTDLTAYASTIQSFGGTWYIHVRHGSGTNSYTEFSGDERSNSLKPALIITYVLGTVWYHNGTQWTECLVYYHNAPNGFSASRTITAGAHGCRYKGV